MFQDLLIATMVVAMLALVSAVDSKEFSTSWYAVLGSRFPTSDDTTYGHPQ